MAAFRRCVPYIGTIFLYVMMSSRIAVAQAGTPPAAAPLVSTATDERNLIARASQAALQYSAQLPNFICKQVTRRRFDPKGDGRWRDVDESSQLISFYEGAEHYQQVSTRSLARDGDLFQPWMNSTGEFGSLLQQIFTPEASARFSRIGSDQVRGRNVQTFSYEVDFKHSKYEVLWREGGKPTGVVDAYKGLVSIDPESLSVLRLTLAIQPLPVPFPVRHVSLTLEYGDAVVAGKVHNLPIDFTMVVQLQKGGQLRNDVTFGGYRRFVANSHLITDRVQ
jgi:hypothetical protein